MNTTTNARQEDVLDMPLRDVLSHMQDAIMTRCSYFGIPTLKSPTDFWTYQEILHATRPDLLIEIGNFRGGSALAFAHLFDAMGHGQVLAVDIDQSHVDAQVRQHPRIKLMEGDAQALVPQIQALARAHGRVMIVEDSAHTYDNTLALLRALADIVTPGCYFIVEDGICYHGLDLGPKPGPYEACEQFLREDNRYEVDRSCEKFLVTWNPKGYLKKLRA